METDFAGKNSGSLPRILPFFTRAITLNLPQSVRNAYFLGDAAYSDFEQLCREWFLLAIAAAAVGWFCYEQITLRPKRKLPLTQHQTVVFLLLGIYLLLGSAVLCDIGLCRTDMDGHLYAL